MANIGRGNIVLDSLDYITDEIISEDDLLQEGDLLFNTRNALELVGKVAIWRNELDRAYYNSNLLKLSFKEEVIENNLFMNYQFNSNETIKTLRRLATGTTSVAAIYTRDLMNCNFVIPSKLEQQKIASIISTWDKAIELKEKLIQQKKEQKKGLMQNLLTGKVRLKGFDGEWKCLKAGNIFMNVTDKSHRGIGTVLSSTQDRGIIPRELVNIDIKFSKDNLSSYKKINKGEFVISLRSFQGGIEYSEYEGLLSPAYTVLRNKVETDNDFYKHLFKSNDFIARLNGLIYGVRDGKQIGFKDFSVLKLPYPRVKEQKQIAQILDCALKEIKVLEQQLQLLKKQKEGLMQLLLTGKVRVKC